MINSRIAQERAASWVLYNETLEIGRAATSIDVPNHVERDEPMIHRHRLAKYNNAHLGERKKTK
jgi:hypothetical protein